MLIPIEPLLRRQAAAVALGSRDGRRRRVHVETRFGPHAPVQGGPTGFYTGNGSIQYAV